MEQLSLSLKKKINIVSLLLLLILSIAAFLRLYRINDYLTFLGDEGRDVTIVRRMITELHPALIGPQTSIGNMYLGPLYYYLMVIPLLIFKFSPIGPAVMVACFGTATVGLIFLLTKKWFGNVQAIIASTIYAVSPLPVLYSRSSWNPNIMPFFALLVIWSIWKFWKEIDLKYLTVAGISFAFVVQSHYLGLLLLPTIIIFWLITLRDLPSQKQTRKSFVKFSSIGLISFILLMSPLVFFDIKHGFINFKAMKAFFTVRQETVNIKPYKAIPKIWPIYMDINSSLLAAAHKKAGFVIAITTLIGLIVGLILSKYRGPSLLILSWTVFGLIGLGLYKQNIYEHYYGFLFAIPFILISLLLGDLWRRNLLGKILVTVSVLLLAGLNLLWVPIRFSPNLQLQRTQAISDFINEDSPNQDFNLALIAKRNYDAGYRYFLSLNKAKVVKVEDEIANNLYVICEDPICSPINHPIAEIANFGWAKISSEWNFPWGVRLFKLVHVQN